MKKILISGGIGSGKSYISNLFEEYGIPNFNFDEEAKKVMTEDKDVIKKIKNIFGNIYSLEVSGFYQDLEVKHLLKKEELAKIIFSDEYKRKQLESIIKPELLKNFYNFCYEQEYEYKKSFIVAESATAINTGLYKMFDEIVLVSAFIEKRKQMVIENRGMVEEDFMKRDGSQLSFSKTLNVLDSNNQKYIIFTNDYNDKKSEEFVLDYIKTNI